VPWLSNAVFEELRAARCVIEGEAASLAALLATKPQVAKLGKLNNALLAAVAAKNVDAAISANYEFHFALYRIAQSTTLLRIIESLWLQSGPYFRVLIIRSFETMTDPFQNLNTNDRLLTAIAANDARGARIALEDDINVAAQLYREMSAQRAEPATVEAVG
jgi:DNA-binding GntR family transcriptional regulator